MIRIVAVLSRRHAITTILKAWKPGITNKTSRYRTGVFWHGTVPRAFLCSTSKPSNADDDLVEHPIEVNLGNLGLSLLI